MQLLESESCYSRQGKKTIVIIIKTETNSTASNENNNKAWSDETVADVGFWYSKGAGTNKTVFGV